MQPEMPENITQTSQSSQSTLTSTKRPTAKNFSPTDGLVKQNIVLMTGLLTAPVIGGAKTLESGLYIAVMFTLLSFLTIMLCRVIPRKIVYTIRIIAYAVVASALYIIIYPFTETLFGSGVGATVGVYLPILVANPLVLSKTESRFYLMPLKKMVPDMIFYILGFDVVAVAVGALRDILVNNRLGYLKVGLPFNVPALETTFGGFILVGVLAGLFRAVYNRYRKSRLEKKEFTVTLK